MKKFWVSLISVIVIILAFICLVLPKYFSSQSQQYLQGFLQGLSKSSEGHITGKVIKQQAGWFSSTATVAIQYNFDNIDSQYEDHLPLTGTFDLKTTTHYGPLIFSSKSIKIGQAFIQYDLANNSDTEKYFVSPLMQGSTFVNLFGQAQTNVHGLKALTSSDIKFNGFKLSFNVNRRFNQMQGVLTTDQLDINQPNQFSLSIAPLTQTFKLNRVSNSDFWQGTKNASIPEIKFNTADMNASLKNITFTNEANFNAPKLNGKVLLNVESFQVNQHQGHFSSTFNFNQLNGNQLMLIQSLTEQLAQEKMGSPEYLVTQNKLIDAMFGLFSGQAAVELKSNLSIAPSLNITLDSAFKNSQKNTSVNFEIKADKAQNQIAGIKLNIADLNKAALAKVMKLLAQWVLNLNQPLYPLPLNLN